MYMYSRCMDKGIQEKTKRMKTRVEAAAAAVAKKTNLRFVNMKWLAVIHP